MKQAGSPFRLLICGILLFTGIHFCGAQNTAARKWMPPVCPRSSNTIPPDTAALLPADTAGWQFFMPNLACLEFDEPLVPLTHQKNISAYTFEIYNRWGERQFHTAISTEGWDGKKNGVRVAEDVYCYLVKFTDASGKTRRFTGTITLINGCCSG